MKKRRLKIVLKILLTIGLLLESLASVMALVWLYSITVPGCPLVDNSFLEVAILVGLSGMFLAGTTLAIILGVESRETEETIDTWIHEDEMRGYEKT